MQDLC